MNQRNSYTYFGAGLVFGFTLCLLMQREGPITFTRLLPVVGYLVALFFWRWIEGRIHTHQTQRWQYIRRQGKFEFVMIRYVVLRGAILSLIFIGPMFSTIDFRTAFFFGVLVITVTTLLGYQEWSDCENQHQASLLRDAATILKAIQN